MDVRAVLFTLYLLFVISFIRGHSVSQARILKTREDDLASKKIDLLNGISVKIPRNVNETGRLFSLEYDTNNSVEGRGKKKKLLERVLPLFLMPFLVQSAIVPIFLSVLKMMLVKSLLVGKLALSLMIINAFKNSNKFKARNDEVIANAHYGYNSDGIEYGAMFN